MVTATPTRHRPVGAKPTCIYCGSLCHPGTTPGGEPTYECTNDRCRWVGCAETMDAAQAEPVAAPAPLLTPELLNLLVAAYEHGLAYADGFHEDAHPADVLTILAQVRAESQRRGEERAAMWRRIKSGQPIESAPPIILTPLPDWLAEAASSYRVS